MAVKKESVILPHGLIIHLCSKKVARCYIGMCGFFFIQVKLLYLAPAVVYSFITRCGINEYTTDNRVINEYTTDNRVINEYTTGHCIKQKSNF